MLLTLDFFIGLLIWSGCDWRRQSVPARPFEVWCGLTIIAQLAAGSLWWPPVVWLAAAYLLVWQHWLGSADAWLLAVLASRFPTAAMLWLLLCACATGLVYGLIAHRHHLPWLPHLALAAVICSCIPSTWLLL